jgi:hypothetical protein
MVVEKWLAEVLENSNGGLGTVCDLEADDFVFAGLKAYQPKAQGF